jgi:hypothetical protein
MTLAELDQEKGASYSLGAAEGHRQGLLQGKHASGGYASAWRRTKDANQQLALEVQALRGTIARVKEDGGQMLPDNLFCSPLTSASMDPAVTISSPLFLNTDHVDVVPIQPAHDPDMSDDDAGADFDEVGTQVGNDERGHLRNIVNSHIETMAFPGQAMLDRMAEEAMMPPGANVREDT